MSSDVTSDASAIVAEYAVSAIDNYCAIAGIVFLLYDYTITFGREVEMFWMHRFSGATVLFLANKYITLLNHLFDLSLFIPFRVSDTACNLHVKVFSSFDYLQYVPWAAFAGLRAFALCKRWPIPVSVFVFLLSLVPVGVNFSVKIYGVNDPTSGCEMGENIDLALSDKLVIISRTCLIAADLILILITWSHLSGRRISQMFGVRGWSCNDVILRNGTIYFCVLLILNVLHIIFTFASTSQVTYFTEPMTAVLVSHFLLDLQETSRRVVVDTDNFLSTTSTLGGALSFARVVGSLDSSISPSLYTEADPELEGCGDHDADTSTAAEVKLEL